MITLKNNNISNVFKLFTNTKGALTIKMICNELGISFSTASRLVNFLIEEEIIAQVGKEKNQRGRRTIKYSLNKDFLHIIGVYVGKQYITVYIMDFRGDVVGATEFKHTVLQNKEEILDKICEETTNIFDKYFAGYHFKDIVYAVTFVVSGRIYVVDGVEKIVASNIWEFECANIKEIIAQRFGVSTIIESDIHAALVQCKRLERFKNYSDIAFFSITMGIGAGIMINNKIFKGSHNLAGEVSKMKLFSANVQNYLICETIRNRPMLTQLEQAYGISSVKNRAYEIYKNRNSKFYKFLNSQNIKINCAQDLELSYIDKAAAQGDQQIIFMLYEFLIVWSELFANICLCVDPQIVILGGDISDSHVYIIERLKELIQTYLGMNIEMYVIKEGEFKKEHSAFYALQNIHTNISTKLKNINKNVCLRDIQL